MTSVRANITRREPRRTNSSRETGARGVRRRVRHLASDAWREVELGERPEADATE